MVNSYTEKLSETLYSLNVRAVHFMTSRGFALTLLLGMAVSSKLIPKATTPEIKYLFNKEISPLTLFVR